VVIKANSAEPLITKDILMIYYCYKSKYDIIDDKEEFVDKIYISNL